VSLNIVKTINREMEKFMFKIHVQWTDVSEV